MPRDDLIQFRRGTAAEWTAADPVLAAGEPGHETDTDKVKVGDGATAWADLAYIGGGDADPVDQWSGLYNATPESLKLLLAASNRQYVGGGPCKIVCVGDSLMQGYFGTTYDDSPSRHLQAMLDGTGLFGETRQGAIYFNDWTNSGLARDPRITALGTGWSGFSDGPAWGNVWAPGGTTVPMELTFTDDIDSVTLTYAQFGGGGTLDVQIGADSIQSHSSVGPTGVGSFTFTTDTPGPHVVRIGATGEVHLHCARGFNSEVTTGTEVARCANAGLSSTQLASDPGYGGLSALVNGVTHDLAVLMIGTNDASGGTAPATYRSNVEAVVQRLQAVDTCVLLVVPPPQGDRTEAERLAYDEELYAVADAHNVTLLDMDRVWGYDRANYTDDPTDYYADALHLNNLGYAALSRYFARALDR